MRGRGKKNARISEKTVKMLMRTTRIAVLANGSEGEAKTLEKKPLLKRRKGGEQEKLATRNRQKKKGPVSCEKKTGELGLEKESSSHIFTKGRKETAQ